MTTLAPPVPHRRRSRSGRTGFAATALICVAALVAAGIGWFRFTSLAGESAELQERLDRQMSANARAERDLAPLRDAAAATDAAALAYTDAARQELRIATNILARTELYINAVLGSRPEEAAALGSQIDSLVAEWRSLPSATDAAGSAYDSLRAGQPPY